MWKYIICLWLCLGIVGSAFSQSRQDTLLVVPAKTGLYVYHVVAKGETLYSLSRKFRLEPRVLASFNGMTLKSPLKLYQLLKIPVTAENLNQSANAPQVSGSIPLYHKVVKGETLYHLGQLYHKVPISLLQTWNHLPDRSVKVGQYVIVGWLDTGQKDSGHLAASKDDSKQAPAARTEETSAPPVAGAPPAAPPKQAPAAAPAPPPEGGGFLSEVIASENRGRQSTNPRPPQTPAPQSGKRAAAAPGADDAFTVHTPVTAAAVSTPLDKSPVTASASSAPAVQPDHALTAAPPADTAAAAKLADPDSGAAAPASPAAPGAAEPAPEPADSFALMLDRVTHRNVPAASGTLPAQKPTPAAADSPEAPAQPAMDSAENTSQEVPVKSAFAQAFAQQTGNGDHVMTQKGAAGWFRSNVKPGSGRYYALCDDLPRGTIVKVSNPINQKSVLVKVLDVIPKQKENYNLIIKLSDAAMGDLGVSQSRFWCEITYARSEKK
jgi:LysM repeat protein